jgi:hypothetical protein
LLGRFSIAAFAPPDQIAGLEQEARRLREQEAKKAMKAIRDVAVAAR